MADKEAKYPLNAIMQYPDQSQYIYAQVADDLERGNFITVNHLNRVIKFKGSMEFPNGICMETVPAEWYTWVMIKPPVVREKPRVVVPASANETPKVG